MWRVYTSLTTSQLAGQDEHGNLYSFTNSIVNNWTPVNTGYWDISIT
jgi:hypothetical protein